MVNSLGIEFVKLAGGEFDMGDDNDEDARPVHRVKVSPFWIARYELTNRQYEQFDPSHHRLILSAGDNDPVTNISWYDAMAFCYWLSLREGRHYRLPTEAEWEYAARGGLHGRKYPWGDASPVHRACYLGVGACPVGSYPPNGYGLYDMAGNVEEWCLDWHQLGYSSRQLEVNPRGPSNGTEKVTRGGSFECSAAIEYLQCAERSTGMNPHYRTNDVGVRLVLQKEPHPYPQTIHSLKRFHQLFPKLSLKMNSSDVETLLGKPEFIEQSQGHEKWLYGLIEHEVGAMWVKFKNGQLAEACIILDEQGRPLSRYRVLEPQCGMCFEDPHDYTTRQVFQFPPSQEWLEDARRIKQADKDGLPALGNLLQDDNYVVRDRVIQILESRYPSKETVALLVNVLHARHLQGSGLTRYRAIEALVRLQGRKCIPTLIEVLQRRTEFPGIVEELSVDALGDLRDVRAIPVLIEILNDERTKIVHLWAASARALGKIGSKDAIPALERLLQRVEAMKQRAKKFRGVDWVYYYSNSNGAMILEREARLAIRRIKGK